MGFLSQLLRDFRPGVWILMLCAPLKRNIVYSSVLLSVRYHRFSACAAAWVLIATSAAAVIYDPSDYVIYCPHDQ